MLSMVSMVNKRNKRKSSQKMGDCKKNKGQFPRPTKSVRFHVFDAIPVLYFVLEAVRSNQLKCRLYKNRNFVLLCSYFDTVSFDRKLVDQKS
jgi:hypothetical protein